jgi:hypothetical protein
MATQRILPGAVWVKSRLMNMTATCDLGISIEVEGTPKTNLKDIHEVLDDLTYKTALTKWLRGGISRSVGTQQM